MLGTAVALSILTTTGWVIIYTKLTPKIKKFLEKHHLLTDASCLVATYLLLGGTLTALLASSMCGLLTSVLLYIANHKDEFTWLFDMKDQLKVRIAEFNKKLLDYNEQYKAKKLVEVK